jgi:hypothetical protein
MIVQNFSFFLPNWGRKYMHWGSLEQIFEIQAQGLGFEMKVRIKRKGKNNQTNAPLE